MTGVGGERGVGGRGGFDGVQEQRQSFKSFPVPLPVRPTPGLRGRGGGGVMDAANVSLGEMLDSGFLSTCLALWKKS